MERAGSRSAGRYAAGTGAGASHAPSGNVMLEADLGEGAEPGLGVLCHLDVVPEGTGWTVPPYALTRREGKLYGRGTIDDKGPAVAALFALGAIRALKYRLLRRCACCWGVMKKRLF